MTAAVMLSAACLLVYTTTAAQEPSGAQPIDESEIREIMDDAPESEAQAASDDEPTGIDMFELIARGGQFMIPIGLMSMLVVTLSVERALSTRSNKVVPQGLVDDLGKLTLKPTQFSPTQAFEICRRYPSAASRVVQSMLSRTGQPLGEIERVSAETTQREADRFATPVRWLTLAAAATPLMGLLGTVWGMIKAFHESSTLTADRSRSEQLSEGIYTALVTTLAGLAVAIPAAILAQYLENRITKLFHRIEELAFAVAPGLARFANRSRMDPDGQLRPLDSPPAAPPPPDQNGATSNEHPHAPKPPPVVESAASQ